MLLGIMLVGALQDALARTLHSGGDPGHSQPTVVYDEHGNAYSLQPPVEASSGPIYQALKEKATTGGQPPAYVLIPAQAPPAYYHPPAAPAYYHPPAPRAMAAANAPTSRTVTGSGGISVVTSTPVSVSNPITIDSPSSSISGGFGFGLFG